MPQSRNFAPLSALLHPYGAEITGCSQSFTFFVSKIAAFRWHLVKIKTQRESLTGNNSTGECRFCQVLCGRLKSSSGASSRQRLGRHYLQHQAVGVASEGSWWQPRCGTCIFCSPSAETLLQRAGNVTRVPAFHFLS